jgi:uncharacterized protein
MMTMFRKQDVRFSAEGGIEISAWLFVPEGRTAPLLAVTMAQGAMAIRPEASAL